MTSPVFLSIAILALSLLTALVVFNATMSSWIAFVTILTFSSGIITLFIYTASITSNENANSSNSIYLAMVLLLLLSSPKTSLLQSGEQMNSFSSAILILTIAIVLILTIIAISIHGHHPNQTVSSSF